MDDPLHVVAAVIPSPEGDAVLLARRLACRHLGGLWEFPGGKVEPGETPRAALVRELCEELGIEVHAATPFLELVHSYPERRVRLDVWTVTAFTGTPSGREGQAIRWVTWAELPALPLPAANRPVVERLLALAPSFRGGKDDR
ncbi:MAG: hypothetical protein KatS3mg124_1604 [Porticoccaceae bacterium]|nr:MAG: hypothetical protein KatS3mg124_1604 [Porticoccaceae bacterium]